MTRYYEYVGEEFTLNDTNVLFTTIKTFKHDMWK